MAKQQKIETEYAPVDLIDEPSLLDRANACRPIHASDQEALIAARRELEILAKTDGLTVEDFVRRADESPKWDERYRTGIILAQRIHSLQKKLQ